MTIKKCESKMSYQDHKYKQFLLTYLLQNFYLFFQVQQQYHLDNFDVEVKLFKKVIPHDYKKMMNLISSFEQQGLSKEQAKVEAFNTFKKGV